MSNWGEQSRDVRRSIASLCAIGALLVTACAPPSPPTALEREPLLPTFDSQGSATTAPPSSSGSVGETPTTDPGSAGGMGAQGAPATSAPDIRASGAGAATPGLRHGAWTIDPYHGFGAWIDVFDWAPEYTKPDAPPVGLDQIDHMADMGVQTIYLQTGRYDSPSAIVEPLLLDALIERAHARDMAVIGWYLPPLVDLDIDLARMRAMVALDIDGFGVDIEARDVADIDERNRRLIQLSAALSTELGERTLSAIVLPPVVIEDLSDTFWPRFPWTEIAPFYDVWMPMAYWTNRRGNWRSAYDYTGENIDRIRERVGDPKLLIHPVGGIGDDTSEADLSGFLQASSERDAIGGSIYDYATTSDSHWAMLARFRR